MTRAKTRKTVHEDDKKIASIKRHYDTIWNSPGWKEFRKFRAEEWDQIIRRRASTVLNQAAYEFLQATGANVDIQSPDVEKDLHDRVAILLSNGVRIDAISLDNSTTAKDDVEDIRIVSAGSWMEQDDGSEISRPLYEQMCRYGVATFFKTACMPEEPEGLPKEPAKALKAREDYFRDEDEKPFGWEYISPLELAWGPSPRNPDVFISEDIVPYVEARELENGEGKNLRMSKDNNRIFWGEGMPPEEVQEAMWDGKTVRRVRRAMRDKATNRWTLSTWVRNGSEDIKEAQMLEEYECPFKHSPFFFVPSGDELTTEQNPHLRYRPALYPLIVDVQELNALVTLLVMTAVWHIQNPFYIRMDGLTPEMIPHIEGIANAGFGTIEGAGAERTFIWRTPEPGTGEVMSAPRLEAMPNANLPESFMVRIQQVQQNILEHKANRYLVGEAFKETDDQPATSTLNQAEAAATPFGPYLTNADKFKKEWLLAEHEAVAYWAESMPGDTDKPIPVRVRGDEPVTSSSYEPGDVVWLTGRKVNRPYILTVTTRNETQAERAMRQQMADLAYEKGAITEEQWLKERGADDPRKQQEMLFSDRMEKLTDQQFAGVLMQSYNTLFQALSGLNSTLTQPAGVPPGGNVPVDASGGGAPTESPGFGVHNGRAPLVEGPSGGTSPAGVML